MGEVVPPIPPMSVGSLFSGIGGLDLGLERAGMRVVWQAELDPYCSRVLAKHWPHVPNLGDVTKVDWNDVEPVRLICGGFPCQPVSASGLRRGAEDERWLWPEMVRCLRVVRPRHVLLENVPGLLTLGFGEVAADLAGLGYDFEWDCIPAAAFSAPHLRYRVLVMAHPTGGDDPRREVFRGDQLPALAGRSPGASDASDTRPEDVADPDGSRWDGRAGFFGSRRRRQLADCHWWAAEPDVGRVAHGVPARVDRLRGLGNAVVPQVAEWIGRRILEASRG